ncbi:MAG: PIN domain-containing protein [Oscillospiraceae bacterium]|jgi:predicted nucleic acid-binding protein|nr:PIN domain-containing protein [Oscillospiraceae bacterium]
MTIFALDTNIISYILRSDEKVITRFQYESMQGNEFAMIPVVYYEVSRWLMERNAFKLQAEFEALCSEIKFLNTNKNVWQKAAELYVQTRKIGKPIGSDADLLIAAYCLINDCTLVTNNTKHFENISDLKYINWKLD